MPQAAPVLPSAFEELIPNPNDDECEVLRKLFAFEVLVHRWYRFAFDNELIEDVFTGYAVFSDEFKTQICEAVDKCEDLTSV